MAGARIVEVLLDQGVKAETFVQLAWEQQPSIGGDCGAVELTRSWGLNERRTALDSALPTG